MRESVTVSKSAFISAGCFYFPADDVDGIYKWYEKHVNAGRTRERPLYYGKTEQKGRTYNFMTDGWLTGQPYEMFSVRFETDCIVELYERLSSAADVRLEPLEDVNGRGLTFCFFDPQGNKFQVWQDPKTESQPFREDVLPLIRVTALFFPVSDPVATHRWYTEFLGVGVSESGHPVTGDGIELYFYRSLEPGRTISYIPAETHTNNAELISIVNIAVNGLDEMHRRMLDAGQNVQKTIRDRGGCGRQFLLADPDGNKLELWEFQAVVEWVASNIDCTDWKERFKFHNYAYNVQIDEFLHIIKNGDSADVYSGGAVKTINIINYAEVIESDPRGVEQLLSALKQFGRQHSEKAFRIVYRESSEFVEVS